MGWDPYLKHGYPPPHPHTLPTPRSHLRTVQLRLRCLQCHLELLLHLGVLHPQPGMAEKREGGGGLECFHATGAR